MSGTSRVIRDRSRELAGAINALPQDRRHQTVAMVAKDSDTDSSARRFASAAGRA